MNPARIDLMSLRLLQAVVRTGSITRGAELSSLALAAASTRLKELEARLGVQLLERHARGVRPTEAGQLVLDRARAIESEIDRMETALEDLRQGAAGHLRIVANVTALGTRLPRDLALFLRAHPGVRLDLSEETSRVAQRMLLEGVADVAVMVGLQLHPDLECRPYLDDELVVLQAAVDPEPCPIHAQDLLDRDLLLLQEGGHVSDWLTDLARQKGGRLRLRGQAKGFEALAQLVAAGLGISVIPKSVALRYSGLMDLQVRPILGAETHRPLVITRRRGDTDPLISQVWQTL